MYKRQRAAAETRFGTSLALAEALGTGDSEVAISERSTPGSAPEEFAPNDSEGASLLREALPPIAELPLEIE